MKELFGILAAIIPFIGLYYYVKDIIKGDIKPSKVTWIIWTLASLLGLLSLWKGGATNSLWIALTSTLGSCVILFLAITRSAIIISKLDIYCLLLSCIALCTYFFISNPFITLYLVLFIDFLGFIPTIEKLIKEPKSETLLPWTIILIANIFALLSISQTDINIYIEPIYFILQCISVVVLIYKDYLWKTIKSAI